jgi:predicted TIM-barrel fold metal-dependent hydrolase
MELHFGSIFSVDSPGRSKQIDFMQYYNVHSHIFTMSNAPERFLELYLPPRAARVIDGVTDTQVGSWLVRSLMRFGGNAGKRYADFLRIGKSASQRFVFEELRKSVADDNSMRFVALTMNMEYLGAGQSRSRFEGQIAEILELKREFDDRLLVFFGLDPRWKDSGTEIRRQVELYFNTKVEVNGVKQVYPFCGLKIYPSTGYYVFDEKLQETFKWAADNGVPVLSHCSYLGGVYNNDEASIRSALNPFNVYTQSDYTGPLKPDGTTERPGYLKQNKFLKKIFNLNKSHNNLRTCSYFLEPHTYDSVLRHFDRNLNEFNNRMPLKICIAHFGGGEQIAFGNLLTRPKQKSDREQETPYGVVHTNWYNQIQALLNSYAGAYTDISYAVTDDDLFPVFLQDASNPVYGSKVMYGTDFFMTERTEEQDRLYQGFKTFASNQQTRAQMPNGKTLWDNVAGDNVENYLRSNFYP